MQAPRKPWEKAATSEQAQDVTAALPPGLDQEFPPVEEDEKTDGDSHEIPEGVTA